MRINCAVSILLGPGEYNVIAIGSYTGKIIYTRHERNISFKYREYIVYPPMVDIDSCTGKLLFRFCSASKPSFAR